MQKHIQNGFTLYELLITVTIMGIILAVGVPNLTDFSRNSRVSGSANDLHGSFLLARSEAARAKQDITICASNNSTAAEPACGGSFDDGWIVFIDLDGNDARDTSAGSNENVLKSFPPAHETVDIATNRTSFSFEETGLGDGGAAFIAMICDERGNVTAPGGNSAARRLVVAPIGRSIILRTEETIATSIGASGTDCP